MKTIKLLMAAFIMILASSAVYADSAPPNSASKYSITLAPAVTSAPLFSANLVEPANESPGLTINVVYKGVNEAEITKVSAKQTGRVEWVGCGSFLPEYSTINKSCVSPADLNKRNYSCRTSRRVDRSDGEVKAFLMCAITIQKARVDLWLPFSLGGNIK